MTTAQFTRTEPAEARTVAETAVLTVHPMLDTSPRRPRSEWLMWVISFVLFLPATIPFITHYAFPPNDTLSPTGLIQPDMPYYVLNARKHFDDGFSLTYSLPFSPNTDSPRIYFQPQTLLMGLFWKATGMDPAWVYLLFGIVSATVCIRLALLLFQRLFGLAGAVQWMGAVTWIWGGGVLVIVGFVRYMSTRDLNDLFYYDPFDGLWFLNLGRNFIYPHEAYYHILFIAGMYLLLTRRYWPTAAMAALMSVSHPFTGIQFILICLTWAVLERFWLGNREVPVGVIGVLSALVVTHLGYYQWFLNRSPEHASLEKQWTLDWTYEAKHFVPAYLIVAGLTAWAMRTPAIAGRFLTSPFHRLCLVWAAVSFALANHEFAFKPAVQPLHFTRGYVWMPLFLLGARPLMDALRWMLQRRAWLGVPLVTATMVVLLLDNAVFLPTFHWRSNLRMNEMYVVKEFWGMSEFLNKPEHRGALIVGPDRTLNYMLSTWTPLRAYTSHGLNTPFMPEKHVNTMALMQRGDFQPSWSQRTLLIPLNKEWVASRIVSLDALARNGARQVWPEPGDTKNEAGRYVIYRIDPRPTLPFNAAGKS